MLLFLYEGFKNYIYYFNEKQRVGVINIQRKNQIILYLFLTSFEFKFVINIFFIGIEKFQF